jgi:hypothetical protein
MQVTDEYLNICKKLPPRKPEEWKIGDWVIIEMNGIVGPPLLIKYTAEFPCHQDVDGIDEIWLPNSPVDWLEMEELQGLFLHKWIANGRWRIWDSIAEQPISSEEDPLLACARAWEKVHE